MVFGKSLKFERKIKPSDPVERISFREVLHPENRKLLQEYMKYEIGIERWQ